LNVTGDLTWEDMKHLLIICFSLFTFFLAAQSPVGTYVATSLPGEIDSLLIKSDATFDFIFHYPNVPTYDNKSISEGIAGTWKVKHGFLYLRDKSGNRMNFKLRMVSVNGSISEVVITRSRRLKLFENLKLVRQ
jgi:hypothetical protein